MKSNKQSQMNIHWFSRKFGALLAGALFEEFQAVRWLSLATITLTVLWIVAARYVGGKFQDITQS